MPEPRTFSPPAASSGAPAVAERPAGITVLLCGYNSARLLPHTLAALANLALPAAGVAVELLVVDNASTDGTAAVAEQLLAELRPPFTWRVLLEPRPGKPNALELGFAQARYRYVCILDDDNYPAPNYLALAWEILEAHPEAGALGGVGEAVCATPPPVWFAEFAGDYAAARQAPQSGDLTAFPGFVFGAGCIIRSAAWQQVLAAGFDSLLVKRPGLRSSGEDVEMCHALALAGYRIWFDERLRFQHFIPADRLTWPYLVSLYRSNAGSEVDLWPYRHFLQGLGRVGPLAWLRSAVFSGRLALRYAGPGGWRHRPDPTTAEGNRPVLLAAYYRWVAQHYLTKALRRDPGYQRVQAFITRLRRLSSSRP